MSRQSKQIKTTVEVSKRFFCFYALLNLSAYRPQKTPAFPLRNKIIRFLEKSFSQKEIEFFEDILARGGVRKEYWFPYRTWILCHGQPPSFQEKSRYWKKFLDGDDAQRFAKAVKLFWKKGRLALLWKKNANQYLKIKKRCLANARKAVKLSLIYLTPSIKDIEFERFVVIPNLLDEYNRGLGPKINKTAYAILGPSPSKTGELLPISRIQHEFLHSIINPLTKKIFKEETSGAELSLIREYLIRAIVLRINYAGSKLYEQKIAALQKRGFKNMEKILDFLQKYETVEKKRGLKKFLAKNKTAIKKACL